MMQTNKKVFVGLSGGVDSSVAALRLINQGYDVTGVFIKVWHPDFLVCNWEAERLDAMRVAAKLGIPFLTCDAETTYRDLVATYFIDEYRAGRTPNPDVMCNKEVKFGVFMNFAREHQADYIATGHYAQKITSTEGKEQLHKGIDTNKDQSYFLWTLSPQQLAYSLFPVGDTTKDIIREEASQAGLLTADKRDSQGVCFLGHIDIPDFLSHYIELIPGRVLNESGEIVGEHKGAFVYTLGQRQGFTLNTDDQNRTPHFVSAKNIIDNTITVSPTPPQRAASASLRLLQPVMRKALTNDQTIEVQTRYRQAPFTATVTSVSDQEITLLPHRIIEAVASGQSCVLYQGEVCLGGGIIA